MSRKANCANRYEMTKLPVEMTPPTGENARGTGENAKGTGENGGRTSEEPLKEPEDYLRHLSSTDGLLEDSPSERRKESGEGVRWKEVFEFAERRFPADNPKNLIGKIMRGGVCSPAEMLDELETADPATPFREAVQYWLMQIECPP